MPLALACCTKWISIVERVLDGTSFKYGAILREKSMIHSRLAPGIESAICPPRSLWRRRPQFAHEFERIVRALNASRAFGTESLDLSTQLLHRPEFVSSQWPPNDCPQIYVASFRNKIAVSQRTGEIQTD